jgi:hypothetical protein
VARTPFGDQPRLANTRRTYTKYNLASILWRPFNFGPKFGPVKRPLQCGGCQGGEEGRDWGAWGEARSRAVQVDLGVEGGSATSVRQPPLSNMHRALSSVTSRISVGGR